MLLYGTCIMVEHHFIQTYRWVPSLSKPDKLNIYCHHMRLENINSGIIRTILSKQK